MRHALLILWILLSSTVALAQNQAEGLGPPYWSIIQEVTSDACILEEPSGECALFPAGSGLVHKKRVILVDSDTDVYCVFTSTNTTFINSTLTATDTGGPFGDSGQGAAFSLRTHKPFAQTKASRQAMKEGKAVGFRPGLCTAPRRDFAGEDAIYQPCTDDTDCDAVSLGTCASSPSAAQLARAGVFMICDAASTALVEAKKEIVIDDRDQY